MPREPCEGSEPAAGGPGHGSIAAFGSHGTVPPSTHARFQGSFKQDLGLAG